MPINYGLSKRKYKGTVYTDPNLSDLPVRIKDKNPLLHSENGFLKAINVSYLGKTWILRVRRPELVWALTK